METEVEAPTQPSPEGSRSQPSGDPNQLPDKAPTFAEELPGLRILGRIGKGGQGSVYVALGADGRRFAVKHLPFAGSDPIAARRRFEREARLLRDLHHPHLVAVHDFGFTADGCYLVMDLLEGRTLSALLAEALPHPAAVEVADAGPEAPTIPLPQEQVQQMIRHATGVLVAPEKLREPDHWRRIVAVGSDLCRGLARLHAAGVVHRDVKPANVVLEDEDRAVLVDLSLVAAADLPPDPMGTAGGGTHGYMSPEQRLGGPVTPRSDVYSLGCTLYECLVGRPPPTEPRSREQRATDLPAANPALPQALVAAIVRCLEPEPLDRYACVDNLRADLDAVLGKPTAAPAPGLTRRALIPIAVAVLIGFPIWRATRPEELVDLAESGDDRALRARVEAGGPEVAKEVRDLAARNPHHARVVETVARALDQGLVRIAAAPHLRVAVQAHPAPEPEPDSPEAKLPARSDFVDLDDGATFAVPTGFVTIRLLSTHSTMTWEHGPLVFQLLRRSASDAPIEVDPSQLPTLGTIEPATRVDWYEVRAGLYPYTLEDGAMIVTGKLDLPRGLAVATTEASMECVRIYQGFVKAHPTSLPLFAHPLEPQGAIQVELERLWTNERDDPAEVSYWLAFRIAGFLAARLPTRWEWSAVAQHSYEGNEPTLPAWLEHQRALGGRRVGIHTPDAFPGRGVTHLLDNAREWLGSLLLREGHAYSAWAPCGELDHTGKIARPRPLTTLSGLDRLSLKKEARAGFRVVRDLGLR